MATPLNILVEVSPLNGSTPVTLRLASLDADINAVTAQGFNWTPCVNLVPKLGVNLSNDGILGNMEISRGDVGFVVSSQFNNTIWSTYKWSGAFCRIWSGFKGAPFAEYVKFFEGKISTLQKVGNEAKFSLLGPEADLTGTILSLEYAGTGGLEGPTTLKGVAKPRAYGSPRSIQPVEIDPINLVYQVHAYGAVSSITPYEFGSPLLPAQNKGNAATYAALIGMTLNPGEYATCLAQGLFRFGGTPTPKITADVVMPSGNRLSDIARAILLDAGVNAAFIGNFSEFDSVLTNVYLTEETPALELLFQLFRDAGGYTLPDNAGVWGCGSFYGSTKTPLALKSDRSAFPVLLDWKEDPTQAPVWRVRYGYDRCWGVHTDSDASPIINDLVGTVSAAQDAATAAQDTAAAAAANADAANARLTSIANDNVLDRVEKFNTISDYQTITGEQAGIDARAAEFGITTERTAYTNAISTLTSYLNSLSPAWNNTSTDTPIVSATFRQRFADVYLTRQTLLNRFSEIAAQRATVAGAEAGLVNGNITIGGNGVISGIGTPNVPVDNRSVVQTGTLAARPASGTFLGQTYFVNSGPSLGLLSHWNGSAWIDGPTRGAPAGTFIAGVEAQAFANDLTQAKADSAQSMIDLGNIANDARLTNGEKIGVRQLRDGIIGEFPIWRDRANTYNIDSNLRTNFQQSYNDLMAYLTAVNINSTSTVTIVRADFQAGFNNYFLWRNRVIEAITVEAGSRATWAGVIGPGRPEDNADVTGGKTAAAITGQGDLATRNAATLPFGTNYLVNSDFTRGKFGWFAGNGTIDTHWGVNNPGWHGHRNTIFLRAGNGTFANGAVRDLTPATLWEGQGLGGAYRFALPVVQGERVYARVLAARHRCQFKLYILVFDSAGTMISAPDVTGGRLSGGANGDPANFDLVTLFADMPANARWAIPMFRLLGTGENDPYIFLAEPAMGKIAAGQTAIPGYTVGRADPDADITSSGISAGISGQGPWATSTLPIARLTNLSDNGTFSSITQIANRDLALTKNRAWTNLFRADGTTAITDAAAITSLGTAAAITGQGDLATRNAASLPFGSNYLVNSDMTRGMFGWSCNAPLHGINLPNWHGVRNTAWMNYNGGVATTSQYWDFSPQALWNGQPLANAPRFALPVVQGDRVYVSTLAARHRCNFQLWILIFNSAGTLFDTHVVTGGRDGGGQSGDPANFDLLSITRTMPANARWAIPMMRMVGINVADPYVFFTEPAIGKIAPGQTVIPAYNSGRSDPNADVTATGVAAAILGQAPAATDFNIQAGADVTAFMSGPPSHVFSYSSDGVLSPSNQMPQNFQFRFNNLSGVVSSGVTWQYRIISGELNGFTAGSTLRAMSVANGVGTLGVTSLGTNTAEVEILGTRGTQTLSGRTIFTKQFAAPPTGGGGGGGGGSAATASQTSGYAIISQNTTYAVFTQELSVTAATATQTVTVNLALSLDNDSFGTSYQMQVERWNGSSWVAMGAAVTRQAFFYYDYEMGEYYESNANFNFTVTAAVTAGSNQRARITVRRSAGDPSSAGAYGTWTLSA